jgi:hypothetical protein
LIERNGKGRFGELSVGQGGHPLAAFGHSQSGTDLCPSGTKESIGKRLSSQ